MTHNKRYVKESNCDLKDKCDQEDCLVNLTIRAFDAVLNED